MMIESVDYTPQEYSLDTYRNYLTFKRRALDQFVYPWLTRLVTAVKVAQSPTVKDFSFSVDRLLFGDRGSGFLCNFRLLKRLIAIEQSNVLIQGCGLGQEAMAWSRCGVASCTGIDLFNFNGAWNQISQAASEVSQTSVSFSQGDICNTGLPRQSFDLISSGAVWEHVQNFDELMVESHRLIKPNGIVFSTFGPLWYTYSGDHFSHIGGLEHGYNHLLLDEQSYFDWINSFESPESWAVSEENYFEIRRHIREGIFSYLKPRDYIQKVERQFRRVQTIAMISPEAIAFRSTYPEQWQRLLDKGLAEEDLLIKGLILYLSPRP
jgi:2-polyprenyl-3-methyl-5-hydroxy-6-metoxy-1,4-benzoquinol methylase